LRDCKLVKMADCYKMDARRSSELAAFTRFCSGSGNVPAGGVIGVSGQTHRFSELKPAAHV
jgi:hypothetical protein